MSPKRPLPPCTRGNGTSRSSALGLFAWHSIISRDTRKGSVLQRRVPAARRKGDDCVLPACMRVVCEYAARTVARACAFFCQHVSSCCGGTKTERLAKGELVCLARAMAGARNITPRHRLLQVAIFRRPSHPATAKRMRARAARPASPLGTHAHRTRWQAMRAGTLAPAYAHGCTPLCVCMHK